MWSEYLSKIIFNTNQFVLLGTSQVDGLWVVILTLSVSFFAFLLMCKLYAAVTFYFPKYCFQLTKPQQRCAGGSWLTVWIAIMLSSAHSTNWANKRSCFVANPDGCIIPNTPPPQSAHLKLTVKIILWSPGTTTVSTRYRNILKQLPILTMCHMRVVFPVDSHLAQGTFARYSLFPPFQKTGNSSSTWKEDWS